MCLLRSTMIFKKLIKIGKHKWTRCKCCLRKLGMLSYKFIKHVLMTHLLTYPFVKNDYNGGIWNIKTPSKQLTKCAKFKGSKLTTQHKEKDVQIDKHGCFLIILYLIITTNKNHGLNHDDKHQNIFILILVLA